jgi:hypothetical protein
MEFLTLKACFGVKSKEFFMKDNMYTLTKRAGCLMVAALLTYLSLGSASWGAPNKTLQKIKDKNYGHVRRGNKTVNYKAK